MTDTKITFPSFSDRIGEARTSAADIIAGQHGRRAEREAVAAERAEHDAAAVAEQAAAEGPFDPGVHTIAEVIEYLDANPDQADAVLAAERDGRNRSGIVGTES